MSDLKKTLERVILNVGDIVVDCINQDIGILTRRVRKFDFLLEELYIWEVRWINKIKEDYPSLWTKALQEELVEIVREGVEIEINYAKEILPNGILGVTADMLVDYIKYLANTRVAAVDLPELYENTKNPFPWLGEAQDATGMTAFFERREKNSTD